MSATTKAIAIALEKTDWKRAGKYWKMSLNLPGILLRLTYPFVPAGSTILKRTIR